MHEFIYFGCVLNESGTDGVECRKKVVNGKKVAGTIRFLVNDRDLQLDCARVLLESLLAYVLVYGSETMIWKEKESSRIRAVEMNNLRRLLGNRRKDRVPNARIRELRGVMKGLMKVFSDGSAMWRQWRMEGLLRGSI